MTSTYFGSGELADVKNDLDITGSGLDTILNGWSDDVEGTMHDIMYELESKHRDIVTLPVLPLTGTRITNSIKNAMKEGVKAKYYSSHYQHDLDSAKYHNQEMATILKGWVKRQNKTREIYGRVV